MKMETFYFNPWVWFFVVAVCLWLCTYVPLSIPEERLRKKVYRLILVPVSLILILYGYPVGIELFRRLAIWTS